MRLLPLRIACEMTADGILSARKCSMLRGAMGHVLRRACCNVRGRECADCMLAAVCPHPRLFMPRRRKGTLFSASGRAEGIRSSGGFPAHVSITRRTQ